MKRITLKGVPTAWRNREEFKCNGTLSGWSFKVGHTGRLPLEWERIYNDSDVAFTVLSYGTPIAWVLTNGEEVKPSVKYSVTTSRHQGRLY